MRNQHSICCFVPILPHNRISNILLLLLLKMFHKNIARICAIVLVGVMALMIDAKLMNDDARVMTDAHFIVAHVRVHP